MEKCNKCSVPFEDQADFCLCNESLCAPCCECDDTCGCQCGER